MVDSIRQRIISAMDTRFKTILTTGGYVTNIGQHVFWWKSSPLQLSDLPGMNCKDRTSEKAPGCGIYENSLPVEIEASVSGSASPEDIRKILADFEKCVGVDETWGGLALATDIDGDDISVEQNENKIGLARVMMTIEYRTARFDAYTQA